MSVDREGLRRAADGATPGPWVAAVGSGRKRRRQQYAVLGAESLRGQGEKGAIAVFAGLNEHRADDAEFCAAARNALPALLDDLAAAREALGRVKALADGWEQIHTTLAPVLGEPPQGQVIKHAEQLRAALAPTRVSSGPREAQAEEE